MTVAQFDHLHLACRDLSRSEAFYVTHFGAEVLARYSWQDINSVALRIGAVRVNLRSGLVEGGNPIDHFGLCLPDVAATYTQLKDMGVDVRREPRAWAPDVIHDSPADLSLGAQFAFIEGPDGEVIELAQRP